MRKVTLGLSFACLAIGLIAAAPSAFAQSSPTGEMQSPKLQPKGSGDEPLPDAIPGVGAQNLPTTQEVGKPQSGDPNVELFTAINANDYNSAQDAISRGADMSAQNSLGETPIDLSVALNRNSITFLLLAARNDSGDASTNDSASAPMTATSFAPPIRSASVPVKLITTPRLTPGNDPGTPNSGAGFLGFNH